MLKVLLRAIFGCGHRRLTWVFNDELGLYRACLDCGARFPYTAIPFAVRCRAPESARERTA